MLSHSADLHLSAFMPAICQDSGTGSDLFINENVCFALHRRLNVPKETWKGYQRNSSTFLRNRLICFLAESEERCHFHVCMLDM